MKVNINFNGLNNIICHLGWHQWSWLDHSEPFMREDKEVGRVVAYCCWCMARKVEK